MRGWLFLLCLGLGAQSSPPPVASSGSETPSGFARLLEGFKSTFTLTPLYFDTDVAYENPFNPANFLAQPQQELSLQARIELSLQFERWSLSASPRLEQGQRQIHVWAPASPGQEEELPQLEKSATTQAVSEAYLNKWRIEYRLSQSLRIGYGRDLLLWGPSTFYSISNPFFPDSGATNPYVELKGQDFAELSWNPSSDWTLSLIRNTSQGLAQGTGRDFKQTTLLKADYIGNNLAASLIAQQRDGRISLGGYGQFTASDALLLYLDARIANGSTQLFPQRSESDPLGWRLLPLKQDGGRFLIALVGAAYTFANGVALIGEYLHDDEGLNAAEQRQYFAMGREVGQQFLAYDAQSGAAAALLGQASLSRRERLGREYALFQLNKNDLWNRINLIALHYANLSDQSSQSLLQAEITLGNRLVCLTNYIHERGSVETHFGQYFASQLTLGLRIYVW